MAIFGKEGAPDLPIEHGKLIRLPGTVGRFQFVCTPLGRKGAQHRLTSGLLVRLRHRP